MCIPTFILFISQNQWWVPYYFQLLIKTTYKTRVTQKSKQNLEVPQEYLQEYLFMTCWLTPKLMFKYLATGKKNTLIAYLFRNSTKIIHWRDDQERYCEPSLEL